MKNRKNYLLIAILAVISIDIHLCSAAVATLNPADYYTQPQVYGTRLNPKSQLGLSSIGVTGIVAHIYRGVTVTVEDTQPNTPAHGKFNKGDVIVGVNGELLKGKNPLVILGSALTKAEASDGVLVFDVKSEKEGQVKRVSIKIPVMGAYSKTFPLQCDKSKKIIHQAAEFYSGKDRMKKHLMLNGLACLFLLSTGDDAYVPRVKEYFSQFLSTDGSVKGIGNHTWHNGYNGVACAEYYLRSGDKSVLPILQHYCDDARDRQKYGIGWGHWGNDIGPAYETGGGLMHCAGNQVLITLLLGKMCGVDVDDKTLLGALRHWYRFVGHGAIPLADMRNYHIFRSAGRDGATACVMQIASCAKGDVTIYKKAKEYLAMSALTSWPDRGYNWEVHWHSLAGHFMLDYDPKMYNTTMQRFRWLYDLGRQPSGAFSAHMDHPTMSHEDSGVSLALAYTAPLKTLHITGASRSPYAKDFTLPHRLWGTEADIAFLTSKHHKDFYKYGEEEEIHIPFWQLPIRLQYFPGNVKDLPLDMMLKNVRHARYTVRQAAAKSLCMNKRYAELEALLRDPDPRLRRAALDGINDHRPWFSEPTVGKYALKASEFTPAMIEAITKMLHDTDEAWYVVDGVLNALSHAPIGVIEKNLTDILKWTTHDDWWLRESAFNALMGLKDNEKLFIEYLPTVIDVMIKEHRYNPRHKMVKELQRTLSQVGNDSVVGKMIVKGFTRAAIETKMMGDGADKEVFHAAPTNIIEVALVTSQFAPEAAAAIGTALAQDGRLKDMDTENLMKIVKSSDGHIQDRFVGLYPAVKTLGPKEKRQLTNLLYDVYRPELISRLASVEKRTESDLIDMIVELTALKKKNVAWRTIGRPSPSKRIWRYHSFDPLTEKDKVHPRVFQRFRTATLPEGMEKWYMPKFDDRKWQSGAAPIGVGEFKAHGHGIAWTATPDHFFKNNSDWGDGEFLLMRTTFEVADTDLDYDYYRFRLLAAKGYTIYLNGNQIETYVWSAHYPKLQNVMMGEAKSKYLTKGTNTLAVYCMVGYEQDKETGDYHPLGQMALTIEGLKKAAWMEKE